MTEIRVRSVCQMCEMAESVRGGLCHVCIFLRDGFAEIERKKNERALLYTLSALSLTVVVGFCVWKFLL